MDSQALEEPLDLLRLSLSQQVLVKMRNQREVSGKLVSYDQHLNMLLVDAQESYMEGEQKRKRPLPALYLRGDGIVLVSPVAKGIVGV